MEAYCDFFNMNELEIGKKCKIGAIIRKQYIEAHNRGVLCSALSTIQSIWLRLGKSFGMRIVGGVVCLKAKNGWTTYLLAFSSIP